MKLKDDVLRKLDNNRGLGLIMYSLDCSHSAAREYVKHNSDNLTKAAMLKAIREEFGIESDAEILEEQDSNEVAK
ncbi:MAG TPA: hypothetical protein VK666_14850 [Chryseolinea sp.]|nr:hypothetical protein [Chryseolinea sp.]